MVWRIYFNADADVSALTAVITNLELHRVLLLVEMTTCTNRYQSLVR